ncbi:hypothetical protein HKCCE3408_11175 [Rhodobacterales bacterium HKCCE3408]|nr:hypothetical protein [Rhodobacterales bacterium HKCCE3408]
MALLDYDRPAAAPRFQGVLTVIATLFRLLLKRTAPEEVLAAQARREAARRAVDRLL